MKKGYRFYEKMVMRKFVDLFEINNYVSNIFSVSRIFCKEN